MWIEAETYIGPCRRETPRLRLIERRRRSRTAARAPSLKALLRQLHANAMDLTDHSKRRRFRLLLAATIGAARRTGAAAAAEHLAALERAAPEHLLGDPRIVPAMEAHLAAAFSATPQA